MTRSPQATVLAIVLAALAGLVDAAGFLHLHGSFVSFMSGNSTRLGVSLATGDTGGILQGGWLIGTFVLGAMLGAVVARLANLRHRAAVIGVEAALLLGAASLHRAGLDGAAILGVVLAMGCENAVFTHEGKVSVGLTYMTGALVKAAHGIVAVLFGARPFSWLPEALLWTGLVCGATAGAWVYGRMGLDCLWIAGGVAAACAVWAAADTTHQVFATA